VNLTDLLSVSIAVSPLEIEHLLDALARLPYPINPDLRYEEWRTRVDFPAWRSWLGDLGAMLAQEQFDSAELAFRRSLEGIPCQTK
jgi:hypothetical protein